MNSARIAWKTGCFAILGLMVLGLLAGMFAKGLFLFTPTYELRLIATEVGMIKPASLVMMSGVKVGRVFKTELNPTCKYVTIYLRILGRYSIRRNADFTIDQAGFLGDQFISITAGSGNVPALVDGQVVRCSRPPNLQTLLSTSKAIVQSWDAISTNTGLLGKLLAEHLPIQRITDHANGVATNYDVLEKTFQQTGVHWRMLTSDYASQLKVISEQGSIGQDWANLRSRWSQLSSNTMPAGRQISENRMQMAGQFEALRRDIQSGKGLIGRLTGDARMSAQITSIKTNLAYLGEKLAQHGWVFILYKPTTIKMLPGLRKARGDI